MKLRETRFDDYAAIARVLVRNGLRTPTAEQWRYFWTDAPHRDRLAGIPMGWVLEHETDGIVGTFRNIAFEYEWNLRPVRVAVASAWAVDPVRRRGSLQLATAYFSQPHVDVLLNTTAVAETSGKAFLAFGAHRVPQPSYTQRLLWITGYHGLAEGMLRAKRVPAASFLKYPGAVAAWMADALTGRRLSSGRAPDGVRLAPAFDERFDRFWDRIRQRPNRLQAVRDRTTLTWRFKLEPEERRPVVVVLESTNELAGYVVLVRRDHARVGPRRLEVADLQVLEDDPERLRTLMTGALRLVRALDLHVVAMSGQSDRKRRALDALKPYRKTAPGWPLYFKALDSALQDPLQSPDAWDLSPLDGDILWSGVFPEGETLTEDEA